LTSAIGVDAGSTKTIGVLMGENGIDWPKKKIAGPGSFYYDFNAAVSNVAKVVGQLIRDKDDVECICLAGAGLSVSKLSNRAQRSLENLFPVKAVLCVSDAVAAALGAADGKPSVVLVLGTGSACYGFDGNRFYRAGGWGWIFGDEGSGYRLGQSFLTRLLGEVDGRYNELFVNSSLFARLRSKSSLRSFGERILLTYNRKDKIASLAPEVIKLAKTGVPEALEILEREALSTLPLIKAVFRKVGVAEEKVYLTGGLTNNRFYMTLIRKTLVEKGVLDVRIVRNASLRGTNVVFRAYKRGEDLKRFKAWT
jgi:N-acetylglucosamine kinase-like BadF-type ATPase